MPSIHQLRPRESGGPPARRGFSYQDHVAVAFFLEMLNDPALAAVWCESHDDITLIRSAGQGETVEFVQVKFDLHREGWTVSKICERDGALLTSGGEVRPASVLEKSLAQERCDEPCSFRIVSSGPVKPKLKALEYPFGNALRDGHSAFEQLVADIVRTATSVRTFQSARGSTAESWVRRVRWDVRESEAAVQNANYRELDRYVAQHNAYLPLDAREKLYRALLVRASEAGDAPFDPDPEVKKQRRLALLEFVRQEVQRAEHPAQRGDPHPLARKLEQAGLSRDTIATAHELRLRYRESVLSDDVLLRRHRPVVEGEVQGRLNELLSAWYAGEFTDTPLQFHNRCLNDLRLLRDALPVQVPVSMLHGLMYDITMRCQHRFTKLGPDDLPAANRAPEAAA